MLRTCVHIFRPASPVLRQLLKSKSGHNFSAAPLRTAQSNRSCWLRSSSNWCSHGRKRGRRMNGNARTLLRVHQLCDTADQWTGTFSSCGRLAVVRFLFHFFFPPLSLWKKSHLDPRFLCCNDWNGNRFTRKSDARWRKLIFFLEKSFKFIYFFI
jgi:hypothetical protein